MANNPYVNKVVYGNDTLIDLTDATATADKIMQGYTAYGASGQKLTGTASGSGMGGYIWQDGEGYVHLSDEGGTQLPDFQTRSVSFNYSLEASGYTNANLKTLIDDDLPSGYRCLGIVGITTNDVYVFVVSAYYANSNYSLQLTNKHDGARNNRTAVIYYLCTNN